MTVDELLTRIRRIYASINEVQEFDMKKLPAKILKNDRIVGMCQDFTGGLTDENIENAAYMFIHNIANIQDHLRKWAVHNGKDKTKVDAKFAASQSLKLIKDLSNNDKHEHQSRKKSNSGLAPRLVNLSRQMQLTTKAEAGSSVAMTLGPNGVPRISGSGTACAVITADVVDKDGNLVGDLFKIEQDAVNAWKELLGEWHPRIGG